MNYVGNRLLPAGAARSWSSERIVCWSRMQAEAGQQLDAIIARKELERQATDGLFLWGVGNAPSRLTRVLARASEPVRAIFSVMKSKPKRADASPAAVLLWRAYIDGDGAERSLPMTSVVTSRADSATGRKRAHYALMCQSEAALQVVRGGPRFDPKAFRNIGEQGGPVGASQVTALLQQVDEERDDAAYEVNMQAQLVAGYWVRLADPVLIDAHHLRQLDGAADMSVQDWCEFSSGLHRLETPRRHLLL